MNATDKAESLRLLDTMDSQLYGIEKSPRYVEAREALRSLLSTQGEAEPSAEQSTAWFLKCMDARRERNEARAELAALRSKQS